MSIVAKNLAKLSNIIVSSRQLLQSTSVSRHTFLCKSSSTLADADNELNFEIIKNGKRLTGAEFLKTVKACTGKDDAELTVVPINAFNTLLKEYDVLIGESSDYSDKYRRALAETENVRKRGIKQTEDAKTFAIQGFCKDLLEVADILDLAVNSVKKEELQAGGKQLKDLYSGVEMTKAVLLKTFSKHGLVAVNPEGEKFDPNLHEALFQVPASQSDKPPGSVAHVAKIGYSLKDRPIRAAKVGVVSE